MAHPGVPPSPLRDKVGYFNHDRFRGYLSVHLRFGLRSPCLRFAVGVTTHHARLGTRLLAKLCHGNHLRLLNIMRFPRRNPHRSVREPLDSYGSCQPYAYHLSAVRRHRRDAAPPAHAVGLTRGELTHPLRSILITRTSSLLQDDPPPSWALILSPFVGFTHRVFSYHHMKGSHVPQKSLKQRHATCTPDTTQPVSRHPLDSSQATQ
jgi:hypothetical protein